MDAKGVLRFGGAVLIGRIIQLVAFGVMAHELSPAQMGVVALMTAIFVGFYSLTNFGFDRYIVYADGKSADEISHTINVIWTLQLIRGAVIVLVTGLVAYCINSFSSFQIDVAYFFGIGAALLIYNLMNPHVVIHEREGNFDYEARLRGISATTSGLSIIFLVLVWADPWVYVIGQIINTAIYALLTFRYSEALPKVSFDNRVVIEVFDYCKHLLLMTVVSFAAVQFENFYVGFMFGPAVLGFYFTWSRFIQLPREVVMQFTDKVLFSGACKLQREGGDFSQLHLIGFTVSLMLVVPFYVFMWNHGAWLIGIVAGSEWVEYWWAGKFFILISFLYLLSSTIGPFTLSCFPKLASRLRTAESLGLVLLMVWMGQEYGVEGVLMAALFSVAVATLFRTYILYRKIITSGRLKHGIYSVLIAALVFLPLLTGEYFLDSAVRDVMPNVALLAFYGIYYLAVGFVILYSNKRLFNEVL